MPGQITHRLAPRDRMSDERDAREIELVRQRGEIVGESVEVVSAFGLIGATMTAAVETDAAESPSPNADI